MNELDSYLTLKERHMLDLKYYIAKSNCTPSFKKILTINHLKFAKKLKMYIQPYKFHLYLTIKVFLINVSVALFQFDYYKTKY